MIRIGVLSPVTGGFYFGDVLAGVVGEIATVGGRVALVQTLDAGQTGDEFMPAPDVTVPTGWGHLDGFVSVGQAASLTYLRTLRAAGIPLVLAGNDVDVDAAAVVADNGHAVGTAVDHLLAHGHTKIGFVGNLAQTDMRDRYEGYRAGLAAHGLPTEPSLYVPTPDHVESGGRAAASTVADAVRARRMTALITSTDRIALGLMAALADRDIAVPDDVAVVGFDDIEAGWRTTPPLATVNQQIAELGATAARLLVAEIRGEPVAHRRHTVSAVFLPRRSCGCAGAATASAQRGVDAAGSLVTAVRDHIDAVGHGPVDGDVLDGIIDDALIRLSSAWSSPETQEAFIETVLRRFGSIGAGDDDVWVRCATHAMVRMAHRQAVTATARSDRLSASLVEQYDVGMGLLGRIDTDPRDLTWLNRVSVTAACLGLWDATPGHGPLRIAGVYDPSGVLAGRMPSTCSVGEFPPLPVLDEAVPDDQRAAFVLPLRGPTADHGLLCVVGAVDTNAGTGRATYNHWAALLSVALTRQGLLQDRQELEEELRRGALYDAVTGLPNRRLFLDRLSDAVDRARGTPGEPFAVAFMDLDGFKLINDSLGHLTGDELLVVVAERLRTDLGAVATAARFGGDEFAVLLTGLDDDEVSATVERIQRRIAAPVTLGGHEVSVTASVGLTTSAIGYDDAEDVLRDADIAMYHAKGVQRGSTQVFARHMHTRAAGRLQAQSEVRTALAEQQFTVHYQPVVDLRDAAVAGFEALVRWEHPQRGTLMPAEFLSHMAETGTIVALGQWTIDRVCAMVATWREAYAGPVAVSVNLSHREFWSDEIVRTVSEALRRHDVPASCLALEITESVIVGDAAAAVEVLSGLHRRGVRLHIDDFGSGRSSLHALRAFPVDGLKIDRSFIQQLDADHRSTETIRFIIGLGETLGLDVVAKGVETTAQAHSLRDMGCRHAQGMLFAGALPAAEAGAMLGQRIGAPVGQPLVGGDRAASGQASA